jgi:hypothetical protein
MKINANLAVVLFTLIILGYYGFSKWTNDQVKIECYKANIELAKMGKSPALCPS